MKFNTIGLLIIGLIASQISFAQGNNRPCMNIAAACESAGYRINDTSGKDIWRNCVKPLMAGQTVPGVTIDPSDMQACKDRKAQRKQHWQSHQMSASPTVSTPTNPTNPSPTPTAPSLHPSY
jgi:hypothetical protein